jgi:hypothetical protein
MKIFNLILAVLFLLFMVVQFNDKPDDRMFWVILYGGIGVISAFAAFDKYNRWAMLLAMAVIIFELFSRFPGFGLWISEGMPSIMEEMSASTPYIEFAREYLGLILSLGVMITHYVRYTRMFRNKK